MTLDQIIFGEMLASRTVHSAPENEGCSTVKVEAIPKARVGKWLGMPGV